MKALEFSISADFGMFRKPDQQDPALTFNFIPKSAVLGVCGAILGLGGYKDGSKTPEFLTALKDFKIAISPVLPKNRNSNPHPFKKTFVKFNNSQGYGNADGNWLLTEQILIKPEYIVTVISNNDDAYLINLERHLKNRTSVFRPYLGKNEFISNIEFLGSYEVFECTDKLVECKTIYCPSETPRKSDPRTIAGVPYTFLIMEEYSHALDEYGHHVLKRFCLRDGSFYREEADLNIGQFYSLTKENKKVIFAF